MLNINVNQYYITIDKKSENYIIIIKLYMKMSLFKDKFNLKYIFIS